MSDIYLKPLIGKCGSQLFVLMESGIKHPTIIFSRMELDQFIVDAAEAIETAEKMTEAIRAKEGDK